MVNLELEHINEMGTVLSVSQEKHREGKTAPKWTLEKQLGWVD